MREVTAKEIKEVREKYGLGLLQAKKVVQLRHLTEDIDNATTIDELKQIMKEMLRCI